MIEPTASAHPSAALSAWAEPLVRGRRVAVLGDARVGLAHALAQRGARLVHAYDPEPARVAEALSRGGRAPGVSVAVLEGDLGVRDGAFDVVVVPDLSLFADPAEIVRRTRRLVAPSGAALFATPNAAAKRRLLEGAALRTAEPPGYYELFDLVSLQFASVRMVGQAPFVGYTVAEFSPDEEPSVTVDTSLLAASEEPEWFVAVASERAVEVEPYAVVELPLSAVPGALGAAAAGKREDERMALAEAQARLSLVTAELEKLRERQKDRSREHEARETSAQAMGVRLVELEKELDAASTRLREAEARAGDAHVRAERNAHTIRELEEELRSQRERGTRLSKQLDDEKKARQKAELELGMIRSRPEISGGKDRIDALSTELDSARSRIAELEQAATVRRPEPVEPRIVQDPALVARVAELEAAIRDAQHEVIDLAAHRDAAEARGQDLARELVELRPAQTEALALRRDNERLEQRVAELERHMTETIAAREAELADGQARDVAALEKKLEERGQAVAELQRDLREAERIGRELLADLEEARQASAASPAPGGGAPAGAAPPPAPAASGGAEPDGLLRGRLDALATKAARCEADLMAASWRIVQLEQRLAEHELPAEPGAVQTELEQALVAAHREVASLRRALAPEPDPVAAAAAAEQLVLLEQVAARAQLATRDA